MKEKTLFFKLLERRKRETCQQSTSGTSHVGVCCAQPYNLMGPQNSLEPLSSCLGFLYVRLKSACPCAWLWCTLTRHKESRNLHGEESAEDATRWWNLRTNVPSAVWPSGLAWQPTQQLPGRNVGIVARELCCLWENKDSWLSPWSLFLAQPDSHAGSGTRGLLHTAGEDAGYWNLWVHQDEDSSLLRLSDESWRWPLESVIWSPGCRADLASVMVASTKTDSGCTCVGLARVPAKFPPSTSLFILPLVMGCFCLSLPDREGSLS